MGKRVFISSLTEGLRQERTALPGLIRALGMDPVRFEDFTALPEPSRDVCLQAVGTSDVYLLLLGEHYGTPFPDTGLSPTHEEYRAAINKGIPRLAFRRRGVTMESAQVAFAAEVEAYATGLFRGSWEEVGELLSAVSHALAQLETLGGPLSFAPIGTPVTVDWLTSPDPRDQFAGFGDSAMEAYLTPVGITLPRARLRDAGQIAPRLLRDGGGVGHNEAIDVTDRSDGGAVSRVVRARQVRSFNQDVFGGTVEGVSVSRTGEVCAWASLHRDMFGAVVNAASLSELATPLVTLAGRVLGEVAGDTSMAVVPSVAITGAGSVSIGDPRVVGTRSSSQISMRGPSVITLPGDESAALSAVISGARDVGVELGTRVEHALRAR
jgi:hypothetical protein